MRRRVIAATLLIGIVLVALGAPWLATHDPRHAEPTDQLQAPSPDHLFGTDLLGRDVFSRVVYGGRRTLGVALLTMLITLVPGVTIGLIAGYAGRWVDGVLMALMDALLAIPSLLLALALIAVFDPGLLQIALAVGIAAIPPYARVTRATVLDARTRAFVEAARSLGTRPAGILLRHILPTIAPTLFAFAGVSLSWAILNGTALLFLGYGGDISAPDWGIMLADGRNAFRTAPWIAFAPGVALSMTVFAINLLASGFTRPANRR
ncbi:MAG: ABC transporter permease [Anaerolineae bacterium]|nr:ABC transporter permease [Anaerolineae bacterium]